MSANTGLTHEKNTDAMGAAPRGAWAPQTELCTLWTRSHAGASPAAGAPGLCPSLSCRGPSSRGAQRPALALAIHPSLRLFRRPSARARVPALAVPSLGAPASRSCRLLLPRHAGLSPSPLVRAVAQPPLPPAAGRSRLLGAGVQFAEESGCRGAAAHESWAGAAQPAVSAAPASLPRGRRHLPCCLAPLP